MDKKFLPGHSIPDLQGFIRANRGDALPIGRPGQGVDPANMTTIGKLTT